MPTREREGGGDSRSRKRTEKTGTMVVKEKKKRPAIAEKQDKKRPKGQAGDKHSTLVLVCMFRRSEADINNSQRATDVSCNYFF